MIADSLKSAVLAGDLESANAILRRRFDIEVDASRFWNFLEEISLKGWSSDSMQCWIKNRLTESRRLPCGAAGAPVIAFTIRLHVFLLNCLETEEMLDRLKCGEPEAQDASVARSKVSHTQHVIHPVDRVAGRVSPHEMRTEARS